MSDTLRPRLAFNISQTCDETSVQWNGIQRIERNLLRYRAHCQTWKRAPSEKELKLDMETIAKVTWQAFVKNEVEASLPWGCYETHTGHFECPIRID